MHSVGNQVSPKPL